MRANAYEEIYDLLQDSIETSSISEEKYLRIRRLLIYLPEALQVELLDSLQRLLIAGRNHDSDAIGRAADDIRRAKRELRRLLGLEAIETYVTSLETAPISPTK
jgi:hypothetical protein